MPDVAPPPPIADQPLSVVLLARGAADLEGAVAGWVTYLNGLNRPYEILLVDDGDAGGAARLPERHRHLRLIPRPAKRGDGACLRAAFAEAKHPLLFYTLCDPRYRPADLRKLLQEIDKVHVASGCRAGRAAPRWLRWLGAVWRGFTWVVFSHAAPPPPGWLGWRRTLGRWLVRLVFGVRTFDPACPFRLLRRDILARIPIQSDGAFVHVEILAKANFLGHLLAEDAPLGDRQHPVVPEPADEDGAGRLWADAARVFNRPKFGPARLPGAAPEQAEAEAAPPSELPRLHVGRPDSPAPLDEPPAPR
jgi:hypothetical protein